MLRETVFYITRRKKCCRELAPADSCSEPLLFHTMSSLYSRSKEYTRNRKSQSDSPPSSPAPTAKTLRHERLSRLESGSGSGSVSVNLTTSDTFGDRTASRTSAYTRRENRLASLSSKTEVEGDKDFKKLYENALSENENLKTKLREAQLELLDIKTKLEKLAQKQERSSDRSTMLEIEKREKRALERKMSEMEEEMKVLQDLKTDNQRLKDENGALIRVISKLSK